ncbi:MAG: ABC transporter substrate-binding protein [Dehalococcoidales bacterium]|nr:ABC transporter substrate-binding protein [Dehalococcoidales bacterium]
MPTTATAPVENKKYGGDLSIIYLSEIMSFDAPVNSAGPIDSILQPPIWENLISYDKDNNKIPVLARDFDVSADGKTITFNLREGIKFQDGTDFNAEAVKYNIDNFKFLRQSFFGNIESVDAIDTYTVRFNLSQPDNQLLSALGQLWGTMNSPTAAKAEIEAGGNQPKIGVIGTGPFKFVDWTRGSSLKVEKWDGYWETGEPYLDSITYLEFSNAQTGVMSFQAGKAQIISGLVPRDAATLKQQGYTIHHCPAYMYALWPSSKNSDSPWSNTDVRLAAEYAIDKAAIVKTYGYGFCEAQYEIALPDKSSYVPGLEPRLYDPDKAKQLLADAGYANGFETTIHALTTEDDDILTAIQGYLSEVGIQANINKVPVPVFMDMGMASTGWEGLRYWYPGTDLEPVATYTAFYWHAPVHTGSMDKPQEMLDAITEAVTSTDRAVVDKALQKVTAIQYDKALTIPLWTWPGISALDDSVNDCAISTIDLHKTWSASSIWLGE